MTCLECGRTYDVVDGVPVTADAFTCDSCEGEVVPEQLPPCGKRIRAKAWYKNTYPTCVRPKGHTGGCFSV